MRSFCSDSNGIPRQYGLLVCWVLANRKHSVCNFRPCSVISFFSLNSLNENVFVSLFINSVGVPSCDFQCNLPTTFFLCPDDGDMALSKIGEKTENCSSHSQRIESNNYKHRLVLTLTRRKLMNITNSHIALPKRSITLTAAGDRVVGMSGNLSPWENISEAMHFVTQVTIFSL